MISEFSSHFQRRVAPSEPRPVADTPAAAAALPASHALLFACGGADDADPAAAALLTRLSLVHAERATTKVLAVEGLNGLLGVLIGHLDEAEAADAARLAIGREGTRDNGAEL